MWDSNMRPHGFTFVIPIWLNPLGTIRALWYGWWKSVVYSLSGHTYVYKFIYIYMCLFLSFKHSFSSNNWILCFQIICCSLYVFLGQQKREKKTFWLGGWEYSLEKKIYLESFVVVHGMWVLIEKKTPFPHHSNERESLRNGIQGSVRTGMTIEMVFFFFFWSATIEMVGCTWTVHALTFIHFVIPNLHTF